jgi:four helix bundle suffix protein
MAKRVSLIPQHGGYRKLKSFQIAQLIYDITVRFCQRYINKNSRTVDQMVQAARSGVQNIAEGSQASGTSKKTELKLTNVARSSLEELRLDYEDFLRQRGMPQWKKEDWRRKALIERRPRTLKDVSDWTREVYKRGHSGLGGLGGQRQAAVLSTSSTSSIPSTYSEIAANAVLTLIAVDSSLLDRQLASQAETFEKQGGFTERLYRVRKQNKNKVHENVE